jgi:tetratricopeptide (TPR) repeat protein
VSLLNLAKTESDDEAMEWAWATGNKRDSACSALTRAQMVSLEPRWGGSYSQMREFAQALTPETPRRPLLANVTVLSKTDAADVLGRAKRYDEAEAMLKEGIADSSDPGLFESLARYHNRAGMPLSVESLSYLIAASRFRDCDCDSSYVARERGEWLVVLLRDPEWARISLERTAARIPKDMDVQMLLANVDWQGGDTVAAEAIYVRAMDIPQYRERALREMVAMFMNSRSQAKANKYNDLYIKEHPSDAWAYYQRAQISQQYDTTGRAAMEVQLAALEHFLLISQGAVPPHVEGARKQSIYRVAQIKEQLKVLGVAK